MIVTCGGLWEESEFEISENVEVRGIEQPCPHAHSRKVNQHQSYDGTFWETIDWTCPFVVVAKNEGGYNSTGVCLDCILEAAKKIGRV